VNGFVLETWDHGRLTVNAAAAELFRAQGWTAFDRIWADTEHAAVAKRLRTDRITLRFELADAEGLKRGFYIKRHTASSWVEYVKPLLQGRMPCLGARVEWNALLSFHAVGLPTMTPIALGERGGDSFLITAALEHCDKLSDWLQHNEAHRPEVRRSLAEELGALARRMHQAGLHHQDFYLGHLLRPQSPAGAIHVIDLGRVQRHRPWFARRWIVKDLAQLNYSAREVSAADRWRFLKAYLGGQVTARDKRLVQSILRKTRRIARHSRKNGL
jgi:heptose I phosphotransferase